MQNWTHNGIACPKFPKKKCYSLEKMIHIFKTSAISRFLTLQDQKTSHFREIRRSVSLIRHSKQNALLIWCILNAFFHDYVVFLTIKFAHYHFLITLNCCICLKTKTFLNLLSAYWLMKLPGNSKHCFDVLRVRSTKRLKICHVLIHKPTLQWLINYIFE